LVRQAVKESGFKIKEVVSGGATGIDKCGENWAKENNIPVKKFPAKWKDITHPDAVIKTGKYGKYDSKAGHRRNQEMAEYATHLIAIDEDTPGTSDMIKRAEEENLTIFVYKPKKDHFYEF